MQRYRTTAGSRQRWLATLAAMLITAAGLLFATQAPAHAGDGPWFRFVVAHSEKCMDVAGGSTAHMANVHQWQCLDVWSQHWQPRLLDDGSYYIINRNSRKCLDVAWWGTHDGADVIQADCTYANNQRWWIPSGIRTDWTPAQRIVAKHSGKCLDVAWNDPANGANIVQSSCWSGPNQTWYVPWTSW